MGGPAKDKGRVPARAEPDSCIPLSYIPISSSFSFFLQYYTVLKLTLIQNTVFRTLDPRYEIDPNVVIIILAAARQIAVLSFDPLLMGSLSLLPKF